MVLSCHTAHLLVFHGSRDPRPQQECEALATLLRRQLRWVETAALELADLPLHQRIGQVAEQAIQQGCSRLQILPLFLLQGTHVMEDIPAEVTIAQNRWHRHIALELCPYLGSHPRLPNLLPLSQEHNSDGAKILIAHGSRRVAGNAPIEAIANQLRAVPAYWAVPPQLETQVAALMEQGWRKIVILPYFLFTGGITDAIANRVQQLAQQYPHVSFTLGTPLGTTEALGELVLELLMSPSVGSQSPL